MEDTTVIKKNYLEETYSNSSKNSGCICKKDFILTTKRYWSSLIGSVPLILPKMSFFCSLVLVLLFFSSFVNNER